MSGARKSAGPPQPGDKIVAKRSAKAQFSQTILILEAFVMLFATLALHALRTVESFWSSQPPSVLAVWLAGGSLTVILLVFSRLAGTRAGDIAGSVAQVVVFGFSLVLPLMVIVAVVFVVLWIVALRIGSRIDKERAEYDAAHPETAPNS